MAIFRDHPELLIKQGTNLILVKEIIRPDSATLKTIAMSHAKNKSSKASIIVSCGLSVSDLYSRYGYSISELSTGGIATLEIFDNLKGVIAEKELLIGMKEAGVSALWFLDKGFKKKFLIDEIGYTREDFKHR